MSKVRVASFSISIDGVGAGPRRDLNNRLGIRGFALHAWFQATEVFKKRHDLGKGAKGVDHDFALQSFENVGAWDPWPQHVRAGSRSVARRFVEEDGGATMRHTIHPSLC